MVFVHDFSIVVTNSSHGEKELSEFNHCSNLRGEKFRVLVADSLHFGWQRMADGWH